jgi:cytoskeleton protein RodZ
MARLGEMLRAARHDMGVSLAEVEEGTKIRHRFLVALEDEDFTALPETIYVTGFLRTYARYLGLDPEQAVILFKEQSGRRDLLGVQSETRLLREANKKSSISPAGVSLLLIVAGLALLLFYGYQQYLNLSDGFPVQAGAVLPEATSTPLVAAAATPTVPAVGPPATPTVAPSPTTVSGVTIDLKVVKENCWVRAIVDDQMIFQGTLSPGEARNWKGERSILLRVGNAGAADITYNGIREGIMGPLGAVREKEWFGRPAR